jgi:hypothetical protein
MDIDAFCTKFSETIPPGTVFQNPGGGTSNVLSVNNSKVRYKRGASTMAVSLQNLFDAYTAFRGLRMSSSELKEFSPATFDSKARPAGHSCNATFFFLALQKMEIVTAIRGKGVRGTPYFVEIPK